MKLVYFIVLIIAISFNCNSNGGTCDRKGILCEQYPVEYYECEYLEHYGSGINDYLQVHTWYEIIEEDFVRWYSYQKMYEYYCTPDDEEDEENIEE